MMPALSSLNLRIQAFFSAAAFAEAGVVESAREILQLHSDRSENVGDRPAMNPGARIPRSMLRG